MATTRAQAERNANREEARKVAEHIEHDLHEGDMPIPIAEGIRFGADAMQHWLQTGQDMARFYNERLAKDLSYLTEAATCRSPVQLASLWGRAASETAHDYAEQLDRVMAINLNGSGNDHSDT